LKLLLNFEVAEPDAYHGSMNVLPSEFLCVCFVRNILGLLICLA